MSQIAKINEYANPEVLVTSDWLTENLGKVVVVETNEDILLYDTGHIPTAIKLDWHTDLNDRVRRDYLNGEGLAS